MSCSTSASFSEGRTRDLAWMPVLRAFMEATDLHDSAVGPVDFSDLRRLASIWRMVEMGGSRFRASLGGTGREACPTLKIEERLRGFGAAIRSEEHTSELQSRQYLVC